MVRTVSLETAKLLKENGFRQDTQCYWESNSDAHWSLFQIYGDDIHMQPWCAAPTTDEILEALPDSIKLKDVSLFLGISKHQNKEYLVSYRGFADGNDHSEMAESLPEALAQMWLYLKKEGLLNAKEN